MEKPDLNRILEVVQGEISFVNSTIKDKGSQRFGRAIALAAILVLGAYVLVYAPPAKELAQLQRRLETAKATHKFAEEYKNIRVRLYRIYAVLPRPNQQSLTANIVDACKLEGIIPDSLDPPQEQEAAGLAIQSVTVRMTESFDKVLAWLLRLEHHQPMLHISSLEMRKKGLGRVETTAVITTITPKVRF